MACIPAWMGIACVDHALMGASICLGRGAADSGVRWRQVQLGWQLIDPGQMALHGLVMAVAMMLTQLQIPVSDLWLLGRPPHRAGAIIRFTAGYIGVWWLASVLTMLAACILQLFYPGGRIALMGTSLLIALGWLGTPVRRVCLFACKYRGMKDSGTFESGCRHGLSCVAACGFLMIVPSFSGESHLWLMGGILLALSLERNVLNRREVNPIAA